MTTGHKLALGFAAASRQWITCLSERFHEAIRAGRRRREPDPIRWFTLSAAGYWTGAGAEAKKSRDLGVQTRPQD